MKETILLLSDDTLSKVKIIKGELISYQKNGVEYMHQKEDKGWNSSDTEMFPVIGATIKNNHIVSTEKGHAVLDQHGLLREFDYKMIDYNQKTAVFEKKYIKNTHLENRKYPNKSLEEYVYWPYDFSFEKKFILTNDALEITFEITSEKGMPYMLGYHPAFKLGGLSKETLFTDSKKITLQDVFDAEINTLPLLNCNKLILHHSEKKGVKINTKGFNHFMLWTEVNNMICIEPITHFPELRTQNYSEKNMNSNSGKDCFSVTISIL